VLLQAQGKNHHPLEGLIAVQLFLVSRFNNDGFEDVNFDAMIAIGVVGVQIPVGEVDAFLVVFTEVVIEPVTKNVVCNVHDCPTCPASDMQDEVAQVLELAGE
jgi:hypothetical protein